MKYVLVLLMLGFGTTVPQTPPREAYPGQSQHQKPPENFYCSPTAKDQAHKCECKRMSQATENDQVCEETPVLEDRKCTVWCHPLHCLCPVVCNRGEHGR